ncbi:hypothetical protein ACHAQJ_008635 [Trichoderma viride]
MATSSTGAVCNQNTKSETRLVPSGTTGAAIQNSTSSFAQLPYYPTHSLNRFLDSNQASSGQYERLILGFAPAETEAEAKARTKAYLCDFDTQFQSSNK